MTRERDRERSDRFDELLRPYVEGREIPSDFPPPHEAADIAEHDLRRTIDSRPPPRVLSETRQRVLDRVGPDTGSYDLRVLEHEVRTLVERAAAEKLAALAKQLESTESELKSSEGKLETLQSERRKFWYTILAGITIGVVAPLITFIAYVLATHAR